MEEREWIIGKEIGIYWMRKILDSYKKGSRERRNKDGRSHWNEREINENVRQMKVENEWKEDQEEIIKNME